MGFVLIAVYLGRIVYIGNKYPITVDIGCNKINPLLKQKFDHDLSFKTCTTSKGNINKGIVLFDEDKNNVHIIIYSNLLQNKKILDIKSKETNTFELEESIFHDVRYTIRPDFNNYTIVKNKYSNKINEILISGAIEFDKLMTHNNYIVRIIRGNFTQFGVSSNPRTSKSIVDFSFAYNVKHHGTISIIYNQSINKVLILVSYNRDNIDISQKLISDFITKNPLFMLFE
jgi:hypothetical protein